MVKTRCQCLPPEAIPAPDPEDPNFIPLYAELHFWEATGTCDGCGRGICLRCGTHEEQLPTGLLAVYECCPDCFHVIIAVKKEHSLDVIREMILSKKEPVDAISKLFQSGN